MQHNYKNKNIVKCFQTNIDVSNFILTRFCYIIFHLELDFHTCLKKINFGLIHYILNKTYIENIHFYKLKICLFSHERYFLDISALQKVMKH